MILKKITLNNIRSYRNQEITFPDGSILLSGDIGSGKTSVLLGIELALFGLQPGQKGTSVLRNGEKQGGVVLEFVVDDKKIIVERTLKRGKAISQDYCAITINGEKRELSVTELKDKILEILNYPKEFAKKQNILYKFTVYTPQEEMKQIILEDPETRLNTLRHVFGIDKYRKIIENTSILSSKLREEKRIKEAIIENFEQDKAIVISKEDELEAKHYNLVSVEKELFLKTEERKRIQEEKESVSLKIEERKKLSQEIEKSKIMISSKKETIVNNAKTLEQLQQQISQLSALKVDDEKIKHLEEKISSAKNEKENLREQNLEISSKINALNLKIKENETVKSKIKDIEICPTCLQDVASSYKSNIINALDSDISANVKKIESLTLEKENLSKKITAIEAEILLNERQLQEERLLRLRTQEIEEKKKRFEELERSNGLIKKDIELLNQQLEVLSQSVFQLAKFENIFEQKQKELDDSMKLERAADIKVAELKKEIEVFSRQIDELRERIKKTQEIKNQLEYITRLETWLSKNFTPLVSIVERNVMIKLKVEFSKLFAEWFAMLVSDTFEVRLSDDFTPIIEHQDYEIDYNYLSGGERTAVALAYRLSLNQVVNSVLGKIKTRDIVILDEPTDGFSEQQLDKMRDVLRQLNVKQLIIVSHEQKIESFVENVIRFRKLHGISEIAELKSVG